MEENFSELKSGKFLDSTLREVCFQNFEDYIKAGTVQSEVFFLPWIQIFVFLGSIASKELWSSLLDDGLGFSKAKISSQTAEKGSELSE